MTLCVRNISKDHSNRLIVNNTSLEVNKGEVVALLGPNGAGKTTLFSTIIGNIHPERGEILLDGINITGLPTYKRIRAGLGYLPQEPSVFRYMSVSDNITAALQMSRKDKNVDNEFRLHELMDQLEISHLKDNIASTLSGGERRRLEIAKSLAINPKYLLLDEPFAGVDPIAVKEISQIITGLKQDIGILITDHNVHDAIKLIDRGYIMHGGSIIAQGSPQELLSDAAAKRLYFG